MNQTSVEVPPGVTDAFRVALEDDTDEVDPVVTTGAKPIVVNERVVDVLVPAVLVALRVK